MQAGAGFEQSNALKNEPRNDRRPELRDHERIDEKGSDAARGGLLEEVRRRQRLIVSEDQGSNPDKHGAASGSDAEIKPQHEEEEGEVKDRESSRRQGVPSGLNSTRDSPGDHVTVVVGYAGAPLNVCSK